eukprot:9896136-Alexandrium_andersonii.AAC.1
MVTFEHGTGAPPSRALHRCTMAARGRAGYPDRGVSPGGRTLRWMAPGVHPRVGPSPSPSSS